MVFLTYVAITLASDLRVRHLTLPLQADVLHPARAGAGGASRKGGKGRVASDAEVFSFSPVHLTTQSSGHLAACLQFGNRLLPQEIWDWIRNLGGGGGATSMGETRGTLVTP